MALSNRDRIQRGLDLLRAGLTPFVERELKARLGTRWSQIVEGRRRQDLRMDKDGGVTWDNSALLGVMLDQWEDVFRYTLSRSHRTLVHEIRDIRNSWAHDDTFSTDAAYRALDSTKLLLEAVSAPEQAREAEKQTQDILRTKFTEQARAEGRRVEAAAGRPDAGLPPWRDVITPHEDVYSGRYEQAEFAADLAQVARGEGADEYRDPVEFFRRTFLTEGLEHLLSNALRRLSGAGGDPVVELQTNFGGGKTHSMLALYHLFSGVPSSDLFGIEPLLRDSGVPDAPEAQRAVLVGTALGPGQARKKPDGTMVRTLWGEMAHQLGGVDAYAMVAEADETGTSPGSEALAELFVACSPCLILIDEWVAYLRNLYGVRGLPSGSFESNIYFVQALTEAARAAPEALVVATLPASQIEIGGEGGEEALGMLKQTFGRMESTWRPATAEEGFEIVRRRLFQENTENHRARDLVVKRFSEMYRNGAGTFPSGCGEAEYARRLEAAYPIHPELFDRLYEDWSSLEKFQRTRGVLRLMASVIHALWEGEDKGLLIMPSSIPMENDVVQFELTRYMEDRWDAVIGKDVDGLNSLPLKLDRDNPNLGRHSACRRVARAIYMGSAPTSGAATPGIEEKNVLLGCVQPGESAPTFGDALRRLGDAATFLYAEDKRYWYSTRASVARLAQDRAEQLDICDVWAEIEHRLRAESKASPKASPGTARAGSAGGAGSRGDFAGVHVAPGSTSDIPDEMEARLVVLGPEKAHAAKNLESPALGAAKEMLAHRGFSPRIHKNTLVFLAPDGRRLGDLEDRVRRLLAWSSISADVEALDLPPRAARQAEERRKEAEASVTAQIGETWTWCLVPEQPEPLGNAGWVEIRTQGSGGDSLATRASKKLKAEELLLPALGPIRLKMELDRALWRNQNHVGVKQLWSYFCTFLYLPRLKDDEVLLRAIREGIDRDYATSSASSIEFAYAEGYDEGTGRYLGLKRALGGRMTQVFMDSSSLIVKSEAAARQIELEDLEALELANRRQGSGTLDPVTGIEEGFLGDSGRDPIGEPDRGGLRPLGQESDLDIGLDREDSPGLRLRLPELPRRFHASVDLDPDRVGRDAGRIADEVLSHLSVLPRARVKVTLEIEAEVPEGAPEDAQRTVSENARTLKFGPHGFERE